MVERMMEYPGTLGQHSRNDSTCNGEEKMEKPEDVPDGQEPGIRLGILLPLLTLPLGPYRRRSASSAWSGRLLSTGSHTVRFRQAQSTFS
jgi:hypothetical protein